MRWQVAVRGGDIPVLADDAHAKTTVILAHGAGSHMEHKTLEWLSALVRRAGDVRVVRFNFLYRALGKSMPDRMPVLIETYRAVADSVRSRFEPERFIIGGHSMGGRVASMLEAESSTADGLLLFGYPLHPAGQLERLRSDHLAAIRTRVLQINGTEDALCDQALMDGVAATLDPNLWCTHWVVGADHSYAVRKTSGRSRPEVEAEIVDVLGDWFSG